MSAINPLLRNLPTVAAKQITRCFYDGEESVQTGRFKRLQTGMNFCERETNIVWNIQIMNGTKRAYVRMSNAKMIYAWIFAAESKDSSNIRQYMMISSPKLKVTREIDPQPKEDYPAKHTPSFLEVINIDSLQETDKTPSVPHEVYAYAKRWFQENHIPLSLLPFGIPPTSRFSATDHDLTQINDTIFLKFFQGIALLAGAYYAFQFVAYLFKTLLVPNTALVE